MNQYLVDFEFGTPEGRRYWLPLALQAIDLPRAIQIAERLEHGLVEKWETKRTGPYPAESGLGRVLSKLRTSQKRWRPAFLNVVEHRLHDVEFDPAATFDEHVKLAVQQADSPYPDEPAIIDTLKKRTFPVRLIKEGPMKGLEDLLVINIISPDVPDRLRHIPIESVQLGKVAGEFFRATIFHTPENEIAAAVEIATTASGEQLMSDQMNSKIWDASIELAGRHPDYYVTRKVQF